LLYQVEYRRIGVYDYYVFGYDEAVGGGGFCRAAGYYGAVWGYSAVVVSSAVGEFFCDSGFFFAFRGGGLLNSDRGLAFVFVVYQKTHEFKESESDGEDDRQNDQ
jgi:hypothetical protein